MTDAVSTVDVRTAAAPRGESRLRSAARIAFPFLVVGAMWEITAHAGVFPPRLFPTLEEIAAAFWRLTIAGILPRHVAETLLRLFAGFVLAGVIGVTVGIAMGRSKRAEDYLLPLVSIGAPIPGIAYAPLFMLWFGLGNFSAILLVGFVSAFPVIFNTWTGVKAVKEIWVRSALVMGADQRRLFRHVIMPGALPYIFTGLRLGPGAGVAHPGGGRAARRRAVGPRLADLRRARIPQHRRDARRRRRHRHDRARAREIRVREARALHRRALGDDAVMIGSLPVSERTRSILRGSHRGARGARLLRGDRALGLVRARAAADAAEGRGHAVDDDRSTARMLHHAAMTLYRMLCGFALAIVVGMPLGIMMGRFRPVENFFMPLASALMPIPSLAWVPVFILWFGLGNTVSILIVFYAALFPMMLNAWSGVRSVNQLWLRAAGAMGANENAMFWKVILPGASPFIITGLRQAFLRAWIAVVGAEMLASSDWGLGWVIYDAKEFLNADVMLAALVVIGCHRLRVRAAGVRLDRARDRAALGHGPHGEGMRIRRRHAGLDRHPLLLAEGGCRQAGMTWRGSLRRCVTKFGGIHEAQRRRCVVVVPRHPRTAARRTGPRSRSRWCCRSRPAARSTSLRAPLRRSSPTNSASRSWSRTVPAPAPWSPPIR